jgi:phosphatidate cytidylyltransferase
MTLDQTPDRMSSPECPRKKELRLRCLAGVALAPLVLLVVWLGGIAFGGLVALLVGIGWWEWKTMSGAPSSPLLAALMGLCLLLSLAIGGVLGFSFGLIAGLLTGAAMIGLARILAESEDPRWLAAGLAYLLLPGLALLSLRLFASHGFEITLFLLAMVWATDIGAYATGRTLGGPKLAPRISPGKTWSGAVGGLLAALGIATLFAFFLFDLEKRAVLLMFCGAVILSLATQIGDLFESGLKRRFGVKDSGTLIPGHGGILDRIDGLIFAAVVAVPFHAVGGFAWQAH